MEKRKVKVLEFGASSLMDYEYDKELVRWTKVYNTKRPKYYDEILQLKQVQYIPSSIERLLTSVDVVIFSIGNKGPRKKLHEYNANDIHEQISSNLLTSLELLQRTLNLVGTKYRIKPLKLIFLNSVAGQDDASYENHAMYAAMKSAMSSIVRTLKVEYPKDKFNFYDLKIPYTQSDMTEGQGESPRELRDLIDTLIIDKPIKPNKFIS
jgi:NAD(P)-dependent dehydrogenase (short-subunit alcohol dehydrogenase family)